MLVGMVLLLIMMLGFCAFVTATSVNGDMMTKDVVCDGILADNYCRSDAMSGIVNLEDLCGANKIKNDNGCIVIVREAEL